MVVGAGTMGLDIAQVFARAGFEVAVRDISEDIIEDIVKIRGVCPKPSHIVFCILRYLDDKFNMQFIAC